MLALVAEHGAGDAVVVDLGVMRDWPYYSGVVYEAYAPGVGEPIAMGGRYDGLAGRFGRARPAVGFAIVLDVLHRALMTAGAEPAPPREGVVLVGGLDEDPGGAAAARRGGRGRGGAVRRRRRPRGGARRGRRLALRRPPRRRRLRGPRPGHGRAPRRRSPAWRRRCHRRAEDLRAAGRPVRRRRRRARPLRARGRPAAGRRPPPRRGDRQRHDLHHHEAQRRADLRRERRGRPRHRGQGRPARAVAGRLRAARPGLRRVPHGLRDARPARTPRPRRWSTSASSGSPPSTR